MEKNDIKRFKQKLLALKKEHLKEKENIKKGCLHKQMKDEVGDLSDYPMHIADVSENIHQQEMEISIFKNVSNIISEIDDALLRIGNENYGICERCKEEIPKERLEILPFARLCVKCQKK